MKNNEVIKSFYLIITIFLIIILFLSGCLDNRIVLDTVEIREYQGEKLSSINDFRENSIKGPQYIDKENYTLRITDLMKNQKNYSYDEILEKFESYKKIITLFCVEGWSTKIPSHNILVLHPSTQNRVIIFS